MPWLYERHAVASLGGRPQALINRQAVDRADVLVAFFDSRLGTATGVDVSGTAEEIRRAVANGIPVHVYFSTEDLPRDVDPRQLEALNEFRKSLENEGLLGDYTDPSDLAAQVVRAIQSDIDERGWGARLAPAAQSGAQLRWSHVHEREQKGVDNRGNVKYRIRRNELVVQNDSAVDAEDLTFTVRLAAAREAHPFHFEPPPGPVTVHAHSTRQWLLIPEGSMTLEIVGQWTEQGLPCEKTWTVTT